MKILRLKRGQERKILEGHLWVFSNQVGTPLRDCTPGEIVKITTRNERFLGIGYVNPHSLIACRILSSEDTEINTDFFVRGFLKAQKLRQKILPGESAVREVFSESDGLPGLILDRYNDILVISINTAGMDAMRGTVLDALNEVYKPAGIYDRSDSGIRKLEGLDKRSELASGEVPDDSFWVKFAGLNLPVDVRRGQKTGLFLDQRLNVEIIARFTKGASVLDAFSYVGAWGLQAAKNGAASVRFLDSSQWAVDQVTKAARRSRLGNICEAVKGDAFSLLKDDKRDKKKYDVIFLDPPSFIQSKSRFKEGFNRYFDINQRAISLLSPGGILVTCSCSHHMQEDTIKDMIRTVLRKNNRKGRILYAGRQSPDHPIHPVMPETEYLHCFALQID